MGRAVMPFLSILGVSVLACLGPAPTRAQYLYLDANGDGLHTAADAMKPNGTSTNVDIYLITNRNRNGSVATCNTEDGDLTLNAYIFWLRAENGTVTFSDFMNLQSSMGTPLGEIRTSTEYKNGRGGGTHRSPGKYKLCSLRITGATGLPRIRVVNQVTPSPDVTSFGTRCSGTNFDNTYALGADWHDADGLVAAADEQKADCGRIYFLRASEEGDYWGDPSSDPDNAVEADVIVHLSHGPARRRFSDPLFLGSSNNVDLGPALGLDLGPGEAARVNLAMLHVLLVAYEHNWPVLIEYRAKVGQTRSGTIMRVVLQRNGCGG